jgi:acetylornithine deacetylase/succinyl-diaminopimelate desuccinylase family protein
MHDQAQVGPPTGGRGRSERDSRIVIRDAAGHALDAYLEAHEEELLGLVEALVRFETPCPPGRNTDAIQEFLAARLAALGAEVRRVPLYPGDGQLVAMLPGSGGGRSLLLNGHVDVASTAPGERWTSPPFAPARRGGRLYGRGAADMKGGLACALAALEAVERTLGRPHGDVVVHAVTGEEMGEAGTLAALDHTPHVEFAIVPEPTGGTLSLGQGGVVTGWITVQSPATFHDAVRRRMIHAGGGVFGASAIEKMVPVIQALQGLERHWAVMKSHPGFDPGATTINPAAIEGGRHPAFVADRCALWLTVHFYPGETPEGVTAEIERTIRAAADADPWLREHPPTFRWGGRSMIEDRGEAFPAFETPAEHPGAAALTAAHAAVYGTPPALRMSPGVCDAGWIAARGIPAAIYGPGHWDQAHAVDEYVPTSELMQCARVYARTIAAWCGAGDGQAP